MIRQDYLLREIERAVEFAIRAFGLREEAQPEEFNQFLQENCLQLTGLSYETLVGTASGKLVSLFFDQDGRNVGRLVASGALLAEAADAHRRGKEFDQARELFVRATEILAFATSQFGGEVGQRIATRLHDLQERIPLFEFPPAAAVKLTALCNTPPATDDQI